jgi:uncharacterized membrane protein YjjP (DUF1212 family)
MSLGHLILAFVVLDRILTILQYDVQMTFRFPFDKLAQDPYHVTIWHLLLFVTLMVSCFAHLKGGQWT